MITITSAAKHKIQQILSNSSSSVFRLRVASGGCSGFSYITEVVLPNKLDIEIDDRIAVDSLSSPLLKDLILDYVDDLGFSGFKFSNPNASSSCGCGLSFDI